MAKHHQQTKICARCNVPKPRSAFPLGRYKEDMGYLKSRYCKACLKIIANERSFEDQKRRQELVLVYLRRGCSVCPEKDILVLQFDHRDPKTKSFNISELLSRRKISDWKLIEEIEKCDVVCANCHTRRTARMFGSWRLAHVT